MLTDLVNKPKQNYEKIFNTINSSTFQKQIIVNKMLKIIIIIKIKVLNQIILRSNIAPNNIAPNNIAPNNIASLI